MKIEYKKPEITVDNIDLFTYTNAKEIKGEIKAILFDFHGLGSTELKKNSSDFDLRMAENNILVIFPFYGPWSWMNSTAVKYVDTILEVVAEKYKLDLDKIKIISCGGSMGGLSALVYSKYAKRTPCACFAYCPVCDLKYHMFEREDLPRTIYLAFMDSPDGLEKAIENNSPYHIAKDMPNIPYVILHGDHDSAVNKGIHSDRFVEQMRKYGKDVTYIEVPGMEHCYFGGHEKERELFLSKIIEASK